MSVCRSGTIALALMKSLDNSASEAEDMTTLIIWASDRTGKLSWGIGSLSEQNFCNPEQLRARVSLRCATLECADKIMLLDI